MGGDNFNLGNALMEYEKEQAVAPLIPHGLFSTYIEYIRPFSESPLVFHIFTLAHTMSCIIGRSLWLIQGEDRIFANLYTLIVAPSSLYKKTSTSKLCHKWLSRLGAMATYLGQIGSPEGLFKGLLENKGTGHLFYSEMGLLLAQSRKKYMVEVLETLNDLFDCPPKYCRRVAAQLFEIQDVYLTLLAASQADSLTRYVRDSDLLSGFLPRFTVVYSEDLQPHIVRRPEPDMDLQEEILSNLRAILDACTQKPRQLYLTDEAWESFEGWAHKQHQHALSAPPKLQPMLGRIETHCLKYAIILQMATDPMSNMIADLAIHTAMEWAEFIVESYRRLVMHELTFTEQDRKVKRVADLIRNAGTISKRDIANATGYKAADLEGIAATLETAGRIKRGKGPRGGAKYEWIG
jgi:hypothetical protein